jgi:hypothetical protein
MPLVQLDFPNPLNVSVQLGDVAYFSNPTTVGIDGIPIPYTTTSSGVPWTSTTTPHLTNEQQDIKKIGEIVEIIPWDGTVSSIICNMPQDLFNQYFAQIVSGGCIQDTSGNSTCTGMCCDYTPSNSSTVAVPQTEPAGSYQTDSYGGSAHLYHIHSFFFDNPTLSTNDYMVHNTRTTPGPFDQVSVDNNWCLIENNDPYYISGYINFWSRMNEISWDDGVSIQSPSFDTVNGIVGWLISTYPSIGFFLGMSWVEFSQLVSSNPSIVNFDNNNGLGVINSGPVTGSYSSEYTETCTQGSFIMFSKDNKANMSSILGYYASVEFRNSSKIKSEIFNVGASFFESSK